MGRMAPRSHSSHSGNSCFSRPWPYHTSSLTDMKRFLTAVLLCVCVASVATAQRPRERLQRAVDSLVTNALAEGPVAGMSVAVVRGTDTVLMRGYGYADVENEVPATAE